MKVCLLGKHSNRTPLSYDTFQTLTADRVHMVETPAAADLVLTGYNVDLKENAGVLRDLTRQNPQTKVVVLSEEPLWDSVWSGGFSERHRTVRIGETELPYTFLNHANSDIFKFDRIPYFLLTSEKFLARYGLMIARHADLGPAELLKHWRNAPVSAAFFAEYRDTKAYGQSFPEHQLFGLSCYRTEVAQHVQAPSTLRVGRGWQKDARRQDLPDWHLDKLATLDMRVRVASSYENTHQHSYISEKIFDAFVVGGVPTYYADDRHQVLNLVPEAAMINTYGQDPKVAAERISNFAPDIAFAEAWLHTARDLHHRFTDLAAIAHEKKRLVNAVLQELETCLAQLAPT